MIKAHLTIYTREYLLILIIFFLLGFVFAFPFLYFMIGADFVCFSGVVVGECICNQFYFLNKCIYGLYLLIKDKRKKSLCRAVS